MDVDIDCWILASAIGAPCLNANQLSSDKQWTTGIADTRITWLHIIGAHRLQMEKLGQISHPSTAIIMRYMSNWTYLYSIIESAGYPRRSCILFEQITY